GAGTIRVPKGAKLMALPQRPYFPIGTLAAAVAYPAEPGTFDAEALSEVITAVGLPALAGRLTEEAHWNRMLSLGEQQRLGIARAILQAPDYLFLDEATASLDEAAEAALYRLLNARLKRTTMVSIGPPPPLAASPRRALVLERDGELSRLREAALAPAAEYPRPPLAATVSPPALGPAVAAEKVVPNEGQRGQQACSDRHGDEEKAPGHVVEHDDEGIDSGRRVKALGEMHRHHGQADRQRRRAHPGSSDFHHQQPHQRGHHMPADERARLRRLDLGRAHDEHDRGGEGHQHEWQGGVLGQELHERDSDRAPTGAGDDGGYAPHGWIGFLQGAPRLLLPTSGRVRSPKATDGGPAFGAAGLTLKHPLQRNNNDALLIRARPRPRPVERSHAANSSIRRRPPSCDWPRGEHRP